MTIHSFNSFLLFGGALWLGCGIWLCRRYRDLALHDGYGAPPLWLSAAYWLFGPLLAPAVAPALFVSFFIQRRMEGGSKNWDLFLSYSHWDCLWASAFYGLTRFAGGEVFLDFVVIERSEGWEAVAEKGIAASDIFLLFDSSDAEASANVQVEVQHRLDTYRKASDAWRRKAVIGSDFPSSTVKDSPFFNPHTGIVKLPIPASPHPDWKHRTRKELASQAAANTKGWLEINLPAVKNWASLLGLPLPSENELEKLMREYLEWAAGGRMILRNSAIRFYNRKLLEAATRGDAQEVQGLIDSGADIETPSDWAGSTPLVLAAYHGHLETARVLLQAGARVNARGSRRKTALILASEKGSLEIVTELLRFKAEINLADQHGVTALMRAVKGGHAAIVQALVEARADVRASDDNGQTALYRARKSKRNDIVEILENAGAAE